MSAAVKDTVLNKPLKFQSRTGTLSRQGEGMLVAIDARVEAYETLAIGVL